MGRLTLHIDPPRYARLRQHLLRPRPVVEEAAFLFARAHGTEPDRLDVENEQLLGAADFVIQTSHHIEVADEAWQSAVKRAHDTRAVLVEAHSHPYGGEWAAAFSPSDLSGFGQTVPNALWRLAGRPYVAIVLTPAAFDVLIWTKREEPPTSADLLVGSERLTATGRSERIWREHAWSL
ncbi:MAG: hypothetical protein ACOZNI_30405 [Myxococcota bacterium]